MKYKNPELLIDEQVAEMLRTTPAVIHTLWKRGLLPSPIECAGLPLLWIKEDIFRLINLLAKESRARIRRKLKEMHRTAGVNHPALDPVREQLLTEWTGTGVYFLALNGTIIYVGSSVNPKRRINRHRTGDDKTPKKDFDTSFVLPVPLEELIETEKKFVALLNPSQNINLRPKPPDLGVFLSDMG